MSENSSDEQGSLDRQSRALLRGYDAMRSEWTDRIAAEGMAASRAFADAVFDRFRGPDRDVAPGDVVDLAVPGGDGERAARLYRPAVPADAATPLALFLHGGGWSLGGIPAYDGLVGSLAALSGVAILSLDYRLAPEHPFPAGLRDARSALDWLYREGGSIGGDPARLAVIGDSAGGNLAAVLAREAALGNGPQLTCQVLIYPMTDIASPHTRFPSRARFGGGDFFLVAEAIEFARENYLAGDVAEPHDPRISPLLAPVPDDLAPAMIVTAGFDPLRDEAIAYHEKLRAAGIDSVHHCARDTIHAFLSFGVLDIAQATRRMIADYLHRMMEPPTQ
jgi:acetyl esterase